MNEQPRGAWALLRARKGGLWVVDGGSVKGLAWFFEGATFEQELLYANPKKCRFVWCPEGVRLGVTVGLSRDGARVIWPKEKRRGENHG